MSNSDKPEIAKLYHRRKGVRIERVPVTYSLGVNYGKAARRKELLIRNF